MDRSQLRNIIESGRAIALDCHAIGKSIPTDDPIGKLFQTDLLNKSILIKTLPTGPGHSPTECHRRYTRLLSLRLRKSL
jgi:hypothetical protein